ncbi:MAG: hypothetical protein JXA71_04010 [Chitinispirillaceae bacterium]|nr:hypothetical protein [Chitinispirillaceae bacterium]
MMLSKDLSAKKSTMPHRSWAGSNRYFGSYEMQKELLLKGYYNRLNYEMLLLEKNAK